MGIWEALLLYLPLNSYLFLFLPSANVFMAINSLVLVSKRWLFHLPKCEIGTALHDAGTALKFHLRCTMTQSSRCRRLHRPSVRSRLSLAASSCLMLRWLLGLSALQ
jgi:hypothetical protein